MSTAAKKVAPVAKPAAKTAVKDGASTAAADKAEKSAKAKVAKKAKAAAAAKVEATQTAAKAAAKKAPPAAKVAKADKVASSKAAKAARATPKAESKPALTFHVENRLAQVLVAPIVSEKATFAAEKHNQVLFKVLRDATKPVSIVISIPDQKAYVYRGETLIAASSVSTGKDGKETPTGTFPILQKEEVHHSNLYDSATMPFMQRLTWDGVAIHAGRNPGFPASHGCIRVPAAFAKKLFAVTSRGTPVMVTEASADEGWTPPVAYDPIQMEAETARANATQLDAIMDH